MHKGYHGAERGTILGDVLVRQLMLKPSRTPGTFPHFFNMSRTFRLRLARSMMKDQQLREAGRLLKDSELAFLAYRLRYAAVTASIRSSFRALDGERR
jgi:hypothetical protein